MNPEDDAKVRRNRDLALIHIAKKQFGLDDERYRGLIIRATGYSSAKDLNEEQRLRVLDTFKRIGFTVPRCTRWRNNAANPMHSKIRYMWRDLYRAGGIADNTDKALDAFVSRMTGIATLRWLSTHQSMVVLEALKGWLRRIEARKGPEKAMGGAKD